MAKAKDPAHGTRSRYNLLGCRCPRCRKANRVYMREYVARRRGATTE